MLVKLTNGKKLSSDEQKKIKGGGILSLVCGIILAIHEPDACGYPVDGPLNREMALSESAQH